ncbi:MAG: hypothetical protein IJM14_03315, partial [Lachnospiraceae bacterium]|nr:hypothetical protein [Lachnospiraceae bacterium]
MKKVLLVVLVMVLSACQKTPETESSVGMSSDDKESLVTSTPALDSSESESPKQEEKDGYALITLEQARMEAKEMAGQTVEGFIMPEKIVVTDGNTIPVYKDSEHQCESYKEAEECFRKLIPRYDEIVAAGAEPRYYYNDEENPESVAGVTYKIESDNDYGMEIATVSDKGFISYDGKIVSFMWEPEERYDIEWGDSYTDDEGYELSDGFVTIKDAIEFTEKRINDSLGELYEGVDKFKVQHLYVFKNEKNGKYVYKMIVGFVFDGQALDTASLYYDSKGGKDKYTFAGFYLNCVMEKSDCLDSF